MEMLLGDHILDHGQPIIQLIRNSGLGNMGLRDECDPRLGLDVGVALPLWVSGYRPSLSLVTWPSVELVSRVLCNERRKSTHADT